MCQLFFDEESNYEISKQYLNKFWTDTRMDGKAQSNMPLQLFQSWGIKQIFWQKNMILIEN